MNEKQKTGRESKDGCVNPDSVCRDGPVKALLSQKGILGSAFNPSDIPSDQSANIKIIAGLVDENDRMSDLLERASEKLRIANEIVNKTKKLLKEDDELRKMVEELENAVADEQQKLLNKLKQIYENMTAFTWPNEQSVLMVPIEAVLKQLENVRAELKNGA